MAGGSVEEGFALETEVGLFAMKRDQVYRALKPFVEAGIEVDIVQLTPLALYNFVTFDQMPDTAAGGSIRSGQSAAKRRSCCRWGPTCRTWWSPTATACGSGA